LGHALANGEKNFLRNVWAAEWQQEAFGDATGCPGNGVRNPLLQFGYAPPGRHRHRYTIAVAKCRF